MYATLASVSRHVTFLEFLGITSRIPECMLNIRIYLFMFLFSCLDFRFRFRFVCLFCICLFCLYLFLWCFCLFVQWRTTGILNVLTLVNTNTCK